MDKSTQDSYREFINTSHDYAKTHNIDDSTAIETLSRAGIASKFIRMDAAIKFSASTRDSFTDLKRIVSSEDFQNNIQNIMRYVETFSFISNDDIGSRLSEDVITTKDKMDTAQQSQQNAYKPQL